MLIPSVLARRVGLCREGKTQEQPTLLSYCNCNVNLENSAVYAINSERLYTLDSEEGAKSSILMDLGGPSAALHHDAGRLASSADLSSDRPSGLQRAM